MDAEAKVVIDGRGYLCRPGDVTGLEWRDIKRETGLSQKQVLEALGELDLEAVCAVTWALARRDDPDVEYEALLGGITLESLAGLGEDEPGEADGAGGI